jgi:hypothetical protein
MLSMEKPLMAFGPGVADILEYRVSTEISLRLQVKVRHVN